ncbi:hypothetical protein E2562_033524 [Oryza meyeriana var. granulata]|uniref:Uncharacterized protein n=1 Tax=Oryza meyeriana var. granulata TaxID=110450 RepID=A0A6G1CKN5_9ORYZ|nr:hypothetical protein E2562_033524 [Oryza meyeriana var. granulata]
MVRATCAVFSRICTIFGAFVPGLLPLLPSTATDSIKIRLSKLLNPRATKAAFGLITHRDGPSRVHSPMMEAEGRQEEANTERVEMYEMLLAKLRVAVQSKLPDWWRDPGRLMPAWRRRHKE